MQPPVFADAAGCKLLAVVAESDAARARVPACAVVPRSARESEPRRVLSSTPPRPAAVQPTCFPSLVPLRNPFNVASLTPFTYTHDVPPFLNSQTGSA